MTKLTDTQRAVLTAAAQRPGRIALPLPTNLRGGAAAKVVTAMRTKGLLEGDDATLRATEAGFAAIGAAIPPESVARPKVRPEHSQRTGTKQAALVEMLCAPEGATLDEIVAALGWQKHTVRGALSGALKKRLGLTIHAAPEDGRGRVYRIVSAAS